MGYSITNVRDAVDALFGANPPEDFRDSPIDFIHQMVGPIDYSMWPEVDDMANAVIEEAMARDIW